jgi:hypothetical protein
MSQKLTERRRLAREARNALSLYIVFLEPSVRKQYTGAEGTARRTICLQDARQALDELTELNEEVEG